MKEEIKKKLHQYIDEANEEQLENMLSYVEEAADYDVETASAPWDDEGFVKEMDRRVADFESGKDKGYSIEAVHQELKEMLEKKSNK